MSALADRVLPLSSTNADSRQAQINLDGTAQDSADLRKVERVRPMPFSPNVHRTGTKHDITRSVILAPADILMMCDERCVAGLEADTWIRGWERPLLELVRKSITPDRPSSAEPHARLRRIFHAGRRGLDDRRQRSGDVQTTPSPHQ